MDTIDLGELNLGYAPGQLAYVLYVHSPSGGIVSRFNRQVIPTLLQQKNTLVVWQQGGLEYFAIPAVEDTAYAEMLHEELTHSEHKVVSELLFRGFIQQEAEARWRAYPMRYRIQILEAWNYSKFAARRDTPPEDLAYFCVDW